MIAWLLMLCIWPPQLPLPVCIPGRDFQVLIENRDCVRQCARVSSIRGGGGHVETDQGETRLIVTVFERRPGRLEYWPLVGLGIRVHEAQLPPLTFSSWMNPTEWAIERPQRRPPIEIKWREQIW